MFYGAVVWDPWLIVAQILCLQCLYYLTLGVVMAILLGTRVSRMSLVYFFDYATVTASTVTGWCVIASFLLSSLAGAVYMLFLIERRKKCLDFSATFYIIHLFICIIYGGWPSSITWWALNGTGVAVMALLGEYLCIRRELREIPITRYRSSKVKLNTDGSARGNLGPAGYGGLFRDERGTWLHGYYGKLHDCSSLEAKIWGVYQGLTIILKKGMRDIEVETDSEDAIKLIQDNSGQSWTCRALVEDARFLARRCNCSFKIIKREENRCADKLAKMGNDQIEPFVYLKNYPEQLGLLLVDDMSGNYIARD